jgi:hypothetical protein
MNEISPLIQPTHRVYLDGRHEGFIPGETKLGNSFFTTELPPSDDMRSMFLILGVGPVILYLLMLILYLPVPPEGVPRIALVLNPLAYIVPWGLLLFIIYQGLKKPGPAFGPRRKLETESRWLVGKLLEFEPYSSEGRTAQLAYRFENSAGRSIIAEQKIFIGLPDYVKRLLVPGVTVGVLYADDQTHRVLWVAEDKDGSTELQEQAPTGLRFGPTGITAQMASTGGQEKLVTAVGWIFLAIIVASMLLTYMPKQIFSAPIILQTISAWMMILGPILLSIAYFSFAMKHFRRDRQRLGKLRDSRTLLDAKVVSMRGIYRHAKYSNSRIEAALIIEWEAVSPTEKPLSGSWTQAENQTTRLRPGSQFKLLYADDETNIPFLAT